MLASMSTNQSHASLPRTAVLMPDNDDVSAVTVKKAATDAEIHATLRVTIFAFLRMESMRLNAEMMVDLYLQREGTDAPDAATRLGDAVLNREYGLERDLRTVVKLWSMSSHPEHPAVLRRLADAAWHKWSLVSGPSHALALYKRAADGGDAIALVRMAEWYTTGLDTILEKDVSKAVAAYQRALLENKYPEAAYGLGELHFATEQHTLAVEAWSMAAQQDHPAALYRLGQSYLHGWGVEAAAGRAIEYLRSAAAMGHTDSTTMLQEMSPTQCRTQMSLGRRTPSPKRERTVSHDLEQLPKPKRTILEDDFRVWDGKLLTERRSSASASLTAGG